ncbi:MAG: hypothetical protein ACOYU3_09350 [Bacillota bacterium]
MDAPGKGILKVASILFIIFGAIATFLYVLGFFASAALTTFIGEFSTVAALAAGGVLMIGIILHLIVSVLELIIGFVGLRKSGDPSDANFFITVGFILGGLALIGMLLNFRISGLIGFVLPIMYILGGYMNKKETV